MTIHPTEKLPDHDTIQQVIGIVGGFWRVEEVIERAAVEPYAAAILRFAQYLDDMDADINIPVEVPAEDCPCGMEHEEPQRLSKWAWKRACRRAAIDPDGPMTMDTKRSLIILADMIQQHEEPPLTMADVVAKAIELGSGDAYVNGGRVWPGSYNIARLSLERMREENGELAAFLDRELYPE